MIHTQQLKQALERADLAKWADPLIAASEAAMEPGRHGNIAKWQSVLDQLPPLPTNEIDLIGPLLRFGTHADCDATRRDQLERLLLQLSPWRKGPISVHGIEIETEWRSDWKWTRVRPHIQSLRDRRVLDVGCGNGYHAWRMVGEGAQFVLGIDPTLLYLAQFAAISRFAPGFPIHMLPLDDDAMPTDMAAFDTVFSMGVLYHRRSPLDHILKLRSLLRPGGELVLETLIAEGDANAALIPRDRYAKMRNVWFIPSCAMLETWLHRCGLKDIRIVDVTATRSDEQHSTRWMPFESLPEFLDPLDANKTIEGYPAPIRGTVVATAP